MEKTTLVIGASSKEERYSFKAITRLREKGHKVYAQALKSGQIEDVVFDTEQKVYEDIHSVTLYIGPAHQKELEKYITKLNPKRVIFNPGTENPSLEKALQEKGIEVLEACTLVLLSTNQY